MPELVGIGRHRRIPRSGVSVRKTFAEGRFDAMKEEDRFALEGPGVIPTMNAMAKEQIEANMNLDETVVHQFEDRMGAGPEQSVGFSDMV